MMQASDIKISKKFVDGLLAWNRENNNRQMPWKGEKDPYKIWLSEIILQQTRVEQGLEYYKKFVKSFPTILHLEAAPELEVFKLWEGLGYYSRCQNLIATAKFIVQELKGIFPADYENILKLKGVGKYTAAAIASFAFNLPYAVLDGNVFRILSRIFDINVPIDSTEGKKIFSALAQNILPEAKAAAYNQAIMDFGAVVCRPLPACGECFFNKCCKALLKGKQQELPVKTKQLTVKERWFHYFIVKHQNRTAIRQRTTKDIWQNLYEFLLVETGKSVSVKEILKQFQKNYGLKKEDFNLVGKPFFLKQRLSHQRIHFTFLELQLVHTVTLAHDFIWVELPEMKKYPFPKTLQKILAARNS
jgi:A/G-specific adenine glycosylase